MRPKPREMMGRFKEAEKRRLAIFKIATDYFTAPAKQDGVYAGRPRPFCLPIENAEENLYSEFRAAALAYFAEEQIRWHQGGRVTAGEFPKPNNHLCSSQVCCVNFLFAFADKPAALAALLRPIFPSLRTMVAVERPGQYVSHEWIGRDNYLHEKIGQNGKRTRGALFTSADAAVMFECVDGTRQIVLIEWKYTESYSSEDKAVAASGTNRTAIYRHLYERDDFPLRKDVLPSFEALFYEPFYQLLRQQMLANEMEKAHEAGANCISLLHIAPAHNQDFQAVTSPGLQALGETVIDVWRCLVREPNRFDSVSVEQLFGRFPIGQFPELQPWWEYITARYPWVQEMSREPVRPSG